MRSAALLLALLGIHSQWALALHIEWPRLTEASEHARDYIKKMLERRTPVPSIDVPSLNISTTDKESFLHAADEMTAWGSSAPLANMSKKRRLAICLGAQKAGTTMYAAALALHPGACKGKVKELNWLSPRHAHESKCSHEFAEHDTLETFEKACFPKECQMNQRVLLDTSPSYLYPHYALGTIDRLKHFNGEADLRFVVLLRDPVERYLSGIRMMLGMDHRQSAWFGMRSIHSMSQYVLNDIKADTSEKLDAGNYVDALEVFSKAFGAESILIVNQKFLNNPGTWERVFDHIGLEQLPQSMVTKMIRDANKGYELDHPYIKHASINIQLGEDALNALKDYYKPLDARLWDLLGLTNAPWW